ncbi:hypothetical protein PZO51_22525 (plasmid) [Enterobacter mori]|nr:hypothetical protein [Enterobacter mori]WKW40267.1 hypothetical protein PZO51_22525 [Enterobacter mori]
MSFIGILYVPKLAMLWAALLGVGSGASMMLGLTFIGLRTKTLVMLPRCQAWRRVSVI